MGGEEEEQHKQAAAGPDRYFHRMRKNLKGDPALAKKVNGTFLFKLTNTKTKGNTTTWAVIAKQGQTPDVHQDEIQKPDCTITISDENFIALASGKINGMAAFMSGKMKLKGDMALAQKLSYLLDEKPPKSKL